MALGQRIYPPHHITSQYCAQVVHSKCQTVAAMSCSPHLPPHEPLVRGHDDPAPAVVRSSQERPSVRGGANGEGQRAVDEDLGGYGATADVQLGHALQKGLQILLKVLADSGLWEYIKENKDYHDEFNLNKVKIIFC